MSNFLGCFFIFLVFLTNVALWMGGWNFLAKLLHKAIPKLDLRVAQKSYEYTNSEGERTTDFDHTNSQSCVFVLLSFASLFTTYKCVVLAYHALR